MSDNKSKRRRYFSSNLMMKKRQELCLQSGFKGFISTTNGQEKACVRESYNILNEYADKLYGEENKVEQKAGSSDEKKDIMDDFNSEIESLKAENSKKGDRRFQAINTGVVNCIFIKTTLDDPVALMDHIVKDLSETKKTKTRYLMRMVPVEVTCKAYIDEVEKAFVPLLNKYFKNEATTYGVVFNRRHNSSLDRDIVINKLAELVSEVNKDHKVNLTNPTFAIAVEVIKNICCLSVIRDYFKYSKYNLNTICGVDPSSNDKIEKPNEEQTPAKNDVDDVSSSGGTSNGAQNRNSEVDAVDAPSSSGVVDEVSVVSATSSSGTVEDEPKRKTACLKTVPQNEAETASEPDADANCKGEPAPEAETTVDSSVADVKL